MAVVLFDGRNLDGWVKLNGKTSADWPVSDGILTVGKGNIMTRKRFGDFRLHLEFNVPYMPTQRGQGRGNSGVFLTGSHELQVLDSYKLKLRDDDCGAIYKQIIPSVNVCKPPLQWQTYDVTFHKAALEQGKVKKRATITVVQNGVTTIDNAEISITPGGVDIADGAGRPAHAPGPREPGRVSQHLDRAARLSGSSTGTAPGEGRRTAPRAGALAANADQPAASFKALSAGS